MVRFVLQILMYLIKFNLWKCFLSLSLCLVTLHYSCFVCIFCCCLDLLVILIHYFGCPFQNDVSGLLAYSLKVCMSLMQNKKFRNEVLRVLVKLYMNLEKPDFINVCQVTAVKMSLNLNLTTTTTNCSVAKMLNECYKLNIFLMKIAEQFKVNCRNVKNRQEQRNKAKAYKMQTEKL